MILAPPLYRTALKTLKKPAVQQKQASNLRLNKVAALNESSDITEITASERLEKYQSCVRTRINRIQG